MTFRIRRRRSNECKELRAVRRAGILMIVAFAACFGLVGCASDKMPIPPAAVADCNLPEKLQAKEAVTPLPTDHDLTSAEQQQLIKDHLLHEKQVADRSNDKTDFVNANCRPGAPKPVTVEPKEKKKLFGIF